MPTVESKRRKNSLSYKNQLSLHHKKWKKSLQWKQIMWFVYINFGALLEIQYFI